MNSVTLEGWVQGNVTQARQGGWVKNGHFLRDTIMQWPLLRSSEMYVHDTQRISLTPLLWQTSYYVFEKSSHNVANVILRFWLSVLSTHCYGRNITFSIVFSIDSLVGSMVA